MKALRCFIIASVACLMPALASAQMTSLTIDAGGTNVVSPGDSISVDVVVTSTQPSGIFGWSLAVPHDPAKLQIDSVSQGILDDALPMGFPTAFEEVSIISNASGDGFINATVLSLTEGFFFPAGSTQILSQASYTNIMQVDGDTVVLSVVDEGLANLPSPAVAAGVSFVGGIVIEASDGLAFNALTLENEVPPPFEFQAGTADVVAIIGQDPIEASVSISIEQVAPYLGNADQDFASFAMGLEHDGGQLEVLSVDAVAGTTDAASVAFFGVTLLANGWVLGVVAETDPMDPFADLNASPAIDVASATYGPAGPAPVGGEIYNSALTFVDTLDSGSGVPVVNEVIVDNGGSTEIAAVALSNGSVSLEARSTIDFIRGDCNDDGLVNIADGITILQQIVASTGGTGALDCVAACDADGMTPMGGTQAVGINDAVLVLAYSLGLDPADLSMIAPGAAVLPDPGPACGQFAGQQPEDCQAFDSCP